MHVPAKLEGGRRRVQGEHALQSKPVAELVFQFASAEISVNEPQPLNTARAWYFSSWGSQGPV